MQQKSVKKVAANFGDLKLLRNFAVANAIERMAR